MIFLVTGATGHVGSELVRHLRAGGHAVRALVRDRQTQSLGVETVQGDLDDLTTVAPALDGVRGLFLLPGFADMPGLVDLAVKAGVDRIVLLSGPSAGDGHTGNAITEYMARSEDAVRAGAKRWTIIRPSGFMSNTYQWRSQLADGDVVRAPFARVAIAVIDPADIADIAALALTEPGHDGAVHRITGPEALRPADQVAMLADALGRNLRFEPEPDDEARARMSATIPMKYVDATFDFNVGGSLDDSRVLPMFEQVIGRRPRTFHEWVLAHLDDWR